MLGCSATPKPVNFAAPAPAGALDCALRHLSNLGYTPTQGGVADGYIRFQAQVDRSGANLATGVGTRIATMGMKGRTYVAQNLLTVTGADRTLRVQAWSMDSNGKITDASDQVRVDAEGLLAGCGLPSGSNRVSNP
jgi:hypothetical protein